MTPTERALAFREWITSDAPFKGDATKAAFPTTAGTVGALVGHLNRVCGGDVNRRMFLHWCFGVDSSRDLHVRDRNALLAWLAPKHFDYAERVPLDYEAPDLDAETERGQWLVRRQCRVTAEAVVEAARLALGQLAMPIKWTVTHTSRTLTGR